MRYKIITLIAVFLMGLLLIPQLSEAAKTVVPYPPNYHGGHSGHSGGGYHGNYYGHGGHYYGHGYYGGYYGWPYRSWGGYYPYFGFGFNYGYPGFYGYPYYSGYPAYGYGYPYGSIRTEVKPQSAQVFVDGGFVGKADDYDGWWQHLDLEAGPHRVVFRAPGFAPYLVDIRVAPGQDIHLKYQMVAGNDSISEQDMMLPRSESQRPSNRRYDNRYEPNSRDDQYMRRPPDNRQPPPDADNEDSYYGDQQNQNSNGRPLVLHVEPSDATVYVDGNYYGTANDNGRGEIQVLLPPGNHRVEVVRPGFESFSQDVMVSNDQDNHVNVILRKK